MRLGGKNSANSGYFLKAELAGLTSSPLSQLLRITNFNIHKAKISMCLEFTKDFSIIKSLAASCCKVYVPHHSINSAEK